jgi:hypothetical protein
MPELIPGATYYVGAACGVPHNVRPIRFRLVKPLPHGNWNGMARLLGYELDKRDHAVEERDIYVIAAGLELIQMPYTGPAIRRPANAIPAAARVPRPRTPSEPTTGRNR